MLEPDLCYRALASKDARFDGRFFTAVRTTGVYCRPVCPARTPRRANVEFYACAAAAEAAGYRPCLRCRPEVAPGTPAWAGTSATVSRALRLIEEGALDEAGVDRLAARLGVGARHLRRLFDQHLGVPPLAVARTRRLHFARRLLRDSDLPITRIALAAGYRSIRRFNAEFRAAHGCSPGALRRNSGRNTGGLLLELAYRQPYDWPLVAGFLAVRAIPGVESADRAGYRRTVRIGEVEGTLAVRPVARKSALQVELQLDSPAPLIGIVERVRRLFDLRADPDAIEAILGPAGLWRPGLRVPGAWDGFETAVRAILGQQISVAAASTLAGRLAQRHGEPARSPRPGLSHHFPDPRRLIDADLSGIGLPARRAGTIRALAAAVLEGRVALAGSAGLDAAVRSLVAGHGCGGVDRALHRPACAGRAGRLPRRRPRPAQGRFRRRPAAPRGAARTALTGLAPLAGVRRDGPLDLSIRRSRR